MNRDEVIRKLTCLIDVCQDGEDCCYVAAQGVVSPAFEALLMAHSSQWGDFAEQLADMVTILGGDPDLDHYPMGVAGQGWAELKSMAQGSSESAILHECLRLEAEALQIYQEALEVLPTPVSRMVVRQSRLLDETYQAMGMLCGPPVLEWPQSQRREGYLSGENPRVVS
ncbi:MAG: PA2169 family four-helix-bundle protein [Anaerolineae bacterium]|nr:PA2169 family four-helix-bundle protein [Anaerolineae bacterium]